MNRSFRQTLALIVASLLVSPLAAAQEAAFYVVSYIEATPAATIEARDIVAQYSKSARQEAGNTQAVPLQRIGQPNQFAIVEVWKDKDAQAAHASAAATLGYRAKLDPLLRSPYDERTHVGLNVAPASRPASPGAVYVVTHVDLFPPSQAVGLAEIRTMTDDSRKDPGNVRFDALQQTSRGNHLTLVETWDTPQAVDAHGAANHMKEFRKKLFPISGGLYDERLYVVVD